MNRTLRTLIVYGMSIILVAILFSWWFDQVAGPEEIPISQFVENIEDGEYEEVVLLALRHLDADGEAAIPALLAEDPRPADLLTIEDRIYNQQDFDKNLVLDQRTIGVGLGERLAGGEGDAHGQIVAMLRGAMRGPYRGAVMRPTSR